MYSKPKPKTLHKQPTCKSLNDELTISSKSLFLIFLITILFLIMAFIAKGPTYGIL